MCFCVQAACTLLCNSAPICMHKLMHVNNAVWIMPRQDKHEHDSVPMRATCGNKHNIIYYDAVLLLQNLQ